MKRILIPLLLLIGLAGYYSCQKEPSYTPTLTASKTQGIKKCEPVTFTVNSASGQPIKWLAGYPVEVHVLSADASDSNNLKVVFLQPGSHTVQASWEGYTVSITVNVSDSCYTDSLVSRYCSCHIDTIPSTPTDTVPGGGGGGPHDTIVSLAGDQIHITPVKLDSGAVSGLAMYAVTERDYVAVDNKLITVLSTTSSSYTLNYTGVWIPANSWGDGYPVPSTSKKELFPIQDGTYTFNVILNNITYTGSFTKSGGQYTFTWPYTSGVIISPLVL